MTELPTTRENYRAFRAITTRWMDNDVYGHVNNVIYYSYFDSAVNAFLIEAAGTDIRDLPAIGIVAESSCRYLKELSFPETVNVGLRLERIGTSSVIYQIALFSGDCAAAAALGRFVHVYIDSRTRAVVPIPEVIRTALQQLKVD